jgi:hypothetical protein
METLLRSLMAKSMPPRIAHDSSSVVSALTASRGALRAVLDSRGSNMRCRQAWTAAHKCGAAN